MAEMAEPSTFVYLSIFQHGHKHPMATFFNKRNHGKWHCLAHPRHKQAELKGTYFCREM